MSNNESWRNVGKHVRKLRRDNGLTLKQLAVGCDLSSNAISLVERGEVAPTVITLCKIAHALGVPAASFFHDVCPRDVVITRAGTFPEQTRSEAAFHALARSGITGRPLPESSDLCSLAAPLSQMVLCVSGSIEYEVDDHSYLLYPGDSLSFNAEAFHRWRNAGSETGVAVMVLNPNLLITSQEDEQP